MTVVHGTNIDFQVPSLDLRFADRKNLIDTISGEDLITFTRDSIGTYVDKNGVIQSAANGEARFDHDSDGNSLGLLVEESRTNLFPYSNFVDWFAYNISKISTNNPAPDGSNTAVLIGNATSSATNSYLEKQVIRTSTGALHTYTAYVKATQSGQKVYFGYRDGGPSRAMGNINLDNGAVSYNEQFGDAFITSAYVGNGWYRCRITCLPSGGTGYYWTIGNYNTGDILIWGAQLEQGSFPTSYIPTSGSTVTRAADVASITGSNFSSWWNASESTYYADAFSFGQGKNNLAILGINGSNSERQIQFSINLKNNETQIVTRVNNQFYVAKAGPSVGLRVKAAGSITATEVVLSVNGSAVDTDSPPRLASSIPTTMDIGRFLSNSQYTLNGTISRLAYYPTRLSNSLLQKLTK